MLPAFRVYPCAPLTRGAWRLAGKPAAGRSELHLERDLDLPLRRAAEGARRVGEHRRDLAERRVAERARSGCANCGWFSRLNASTRNSVSMLADLRVLDHREVDVELPGSAQDVAAGVAVGAGDVGRRLRTPTVSNHCVDRRVRRQAVADAVRPVAGARRLHALRLRDRQRQARAQVEDAAGLPAAPPAGRARTAARRSSSS